MREDYFSLCFGTVCMSLNMIIRPQHCQMINVLVWQAKLFPPSLLSYTDNLKKCLFLTEDRRKTISMQSFSFAVPRFGRLMFCVSILSGGAERNYKTVELNGPTGPDSPV